MLFLLPVAVAGHSRLMGLDEEGNVAALERLDEARAATADAHRSKADLPPATFG